MIYTLPNSNNKARVLKDSEGDEFLHLFWSSATTGRHIKEYCGLNKKQYLELQYK